MSDLSLTILAETANDAQAIERLHERTFGPGRFVLSAYRLREHVDHLLDLSFTARIGTLLVGSVRQLPILIGDTKALMLGPLTVEPPFRGRGVGRALLDRALREAKAKGTVSWCWSVTKSITAVSVSKLFRRDGRACRDRSTTAAFWWPSWSMAPSPTFPERYGRTGAWRDRDGAGTAASPLPASGEREIITC